MIENNTGFQKNLRVKLQRSLSLSKADTVTDDYLPKTSNLARLYNRYKRLSLGITGLLKFSHVGDVDESGR